MRKYIFYTLSTLFVVTSIILLALYSNEEIEERIVDSTKGLASFYKNIGKITVTSVVLINAYLLILMLMCCLYPKCMNGKLAIYIRRTTNFCLVPIITILYN
jgi:hypothetical protein